jgi:hypothetical protein
MKRLCRLLLVCMTLALIPHARADSWLFPREKTDRVFESGKVKVVLTTDATKDVRFPDFILQIFRGTELQARYAGLAFEQIFASPNSTHFLGLSNSGIPGTAVVLFDNRGRLLLLVRHDLVELDYCGKSATIARKWYDPDDPQVKFNLENRDEPFVTLRDCKGQNVSLSDVILRAYNKAFEKRFGEKESVR